jgi:hypothetical protein
VTTRRSFLAASVVSLSAAALARPALASALGDGAIIDAARRGLERVGAKAALRDVVGVADFSLASRAPRLYLVDLAAGRVETLLVAHGRGSDPAHTGWLSRFSNEPGSAATSEGDYITGAYYVGHHGSSMRLAGLDATNNNAEAREIVVHCAPYVSPAIARTGVLGRSEGCFAVSDTDLPRVLQRLGPGRLLTAGKL